MFDPPISKAWAGPIFEHILRQLFEDDHCDLLSFGPVSELHKQTERLPEACGRLERLVMPPKVITEGVHSIFWLPPNMEQYFECLGRNERKKRRRYELKHLGKEYQTKVEVVSDPARVGQEFEDFAVQHTLHWQAQGQAGHFGAWPKATEFNRSLVKAHGSLGRMRFVRILANDQVIANHYGFAFGDTYAAELPARAVGQEWEKFSLGAAGIVALIESAIKEQKTRLDGGLGHYEYKVRLGAKEYAVMKLRVVARRTRSRVCMMLYNAIRLFLLYGYHKIWYRRITPHLPALFRRPQWTYWLRLDF